MGFWKATEEYLMPFVLISREQTLLIFKGTEWLQEQASLKTEGSG